MKDVKNMYYDGWEGGGANSASLCRYMYLPKFAYTTAKKGTIVICT